MFFGLFVLFEVKVHILPTAKLASYLFGFASFQYVVVLFILPVFYFSAKNFDFSQKNKNSLKIIRFPVSGELEGGTIPEG